MSSVLIQFFIPLRDNKGNYFPTKTFDDIRNELTCRFGGVTAYLHSPSKGAWLDADGRMEHDEMVLVEVVVEELDRNWWVAYRSQLEQTFKQDRILMRATVIDVL